MQNDLYRVITVQAGAAKYDVSRHVSSLTIEEDSSKPARLTLELGDPFMVLSHALQAGMRVTVDLGIKSDHSIVFQGKIYRVEAGFPERAAPMLKLVAYDKSLTMGLRKRNRIWTNTYLDQIVNTITSDYSFNPADVQIQLKGNPYFSGNGIRQQDETDLGFLLRLAAKYGCEMCVLPYNDREQLLFRAQSYIMKTQPQVTLYYMRTGVADQLTSFEATSEVSKIQLPRMFTGIDFKSGKQIQNTVSPVEVVGNTQDRFFDENSTNFATQYPELTDSLGELIAAADTTQKDLQTQLGTSEFIALPGFVTQADLSVLVDNQFSTSIYGMRASGTAPGNHRIHAQSTIDIANAGAFSGIWYLSQVLHVVNDNNYQMEIQCQR